uniref:Uncharacterized protein n=1 Tax=Anguilla anguilla TaxID=7936 RepID=A0A0E9TUR6_ANGAN
MPRQGGKP